MARPTGYGALAVQIVVPALSYWERIRGSRAMPRRSDIDPAEIPQLLPFVMLVDVFENPRDFRFRLVGTEIDAITAVSLRGQRFSENRQLGSGSNVWNHYEAVIRTRQPLTAPVDYVGSDRFVRAIRHCLMPLSEDGETVNMIFVAVEVVRSTQLLATAARAP
jgi:hypothetical protein